MRSAMAPEFTCCTSGNSIVKGNGHPNKKSSRPRRRTMNNRHVQHKGMLTRGAWVCFSKEHSRRASARKLRFTTSSMNVSSHSKTASRNQENTSRKTGTV